MELELRRRVEVRLGLQAARAVPIDEGWDSIVFEVDDEWIVRVPRREEVRDWVRKEARLLPELAASLPAPIPRFEVLEDAGPVFFVAYRKLEGEPLGPSACRATSLAVQLGGFLAALHAFPRERALTAGLAEIDGARWLDQQRTLARLLEAEVVPLLTRAEREAARALFEEFFSSWDSGRRTVLIHGDLGPEHILHQGSSLSGVIDWSDARLGDLALDFAWLLHGTTDDFAATLLRAYGGDATLRDRALFYHRLGPWHEALYGVEQERPELVESGLAGIRARLPG